MKTTISNDVLSAAIAAVRSQRPLVHNITNYVVMNNSANALLAVGASPVMAHWTQEMEEMVGIANALVLNIGTLDENWLESMRVAGVAAKRRGIPIVLDPVGAGATSARTTTSLELIELCHPTVIKKFCAILRLHISKKGAPAGTPSVTGLAGFCNAIIYV